MDLRRKATSGARNTTYRSGFQRAGMYKKTHRKKDSLSLSSHDADFPYSVENRIVAGQQNLPRKSVPPFIHKIVFIIAESIQVVKAHGEPPLAIRRGRGIPIHPLDVLMS